MAAHDLRFIFIDLVQSAADHLVGYGICKQHQQIRPADLLIQAGTHLGKYLCLAVITLTDLLILTDHSVVASNNNNTHTDSSLQIRGGTETLLYTAPQRYNCKMVSTH